MIHRELESVNPSETVELHPLDTHIMGGVALRGLMCDDTVLQVLDRLQQSFDIIRDAPQKAIEEAKIKSEKQGVIIKPKTEFGESIAYSVPRLDDTQVIDELFIDVAKSQNHGMHTTPLKASEREGVEFLWNGSDPLSKQEIILYRRTSSLVMSDYAPHQGTIYALKSKVTPSKKPAWGWA